jgi:hypothetical protein
MPHKPPPTTSTPDTSSPDAPRGDADNVASNGYWLRDEIGPRHYVAPAGDRAGATDLIGRIETALGDLPGIDARRLHLSLDGAGLAVGGTARSEHERDRAVQAIRAIAGEVTVTNRIALEPLPGADAQAPGE